MKAEKLAVVAERVKHHYDAHTLRKLEWNKKNQEFALNPQISQQQGQKVTFDVEFLVSSPIMTTIIS